MNFKTLSDETLILSTKKAVHFETTATTNVVRHFKEIFDRDLYLKRGYSSMYLMARDEFGYDNSSAIRRTNALELALAVPAVLGKIDRGEMCLQSAADIQSFLNKERGRKKAYSLEQKVELVDACSGLSCLSVQVELAKRNPDLDFKESKRFVAEDRMKITYTTKISTEQKLERIKELRSHVNPYMSRDELIDYIAEIALDAIDPIRKDQRAERREAKKREVQNGKACEVAFGEAMKDLKIREEIVSEAGEIQLEVEFEKAAEAKVSVPKQTRARSPSVRGDRLIRKSNAGQGCIFVDSLTGRRCGSKYQEQRDHVVEFSRGGSNEPENFQILCAKHNRFRWRQRSASQVRDLQLAYG
jgi:hypothetical protein